MPNVPQLAASAEVDYLRTKSQSTECVVGPGIERPGIQLDVPDTYGSRFIHNVFDKGPCHTFSSKLRGHADLVYFAVCPSKTERILRAIVINGQRIARRQSIRLRNPSPAVGIFQRLPVPLSHFDGFNRLEPLRSVRDMQFLNVAIQIRKNFRVTLARLSNGNHHRILFSDGSSLEADRWSGLLSLLNLLHQDYICRIGKRISHGNKKAMLNIEIECTCIPIRNLGCDPILSTQKRLHA